MSNQWLEFQSFQSNQQLLRAINVISIYIKLNLAGIADKDKLDDATDAKRFLSLFLRGWEEIVNKFENVAHGPLIGVDPRMKELTSNYVARRREVGKYRSDLFRKSPRDVADLLEASTTDQQRALLSSLSELRKLLEEHVYSDSVQIMGEI